MLLFETTISVLIHIKGWDREKERRKIKVRERERRPKTLKCLKVKR